MNSMLRTTGLMLLAAGFVGAQGWHIDVVDPTGIGRFSSLKIDKDGNAHVAYVIDDGNKFPLRYGFWDHTVRRWFLMNVAEGASFCALVLDSKQRPHISWADNGTVPGTKLRYAYWDGKKWQKPTIPLNSDIVGYYTSLVLDAEDHPRISFYEYRGARGTDTKIRMRVVMWNGKYWQVRTIDDQEGSGKFNALAIDPQGRVHLAYANVSAGTAGMRYAVGNDAAWKTEIVDGPEQNKGGSVGYSANIVVDDNGDPHLTYMNESTPLVKYAVQKDGKWEIQTVDRVSGVGYPDRNSIALDEQGRPYIGYYDSVRGQLKVAHQEGTKWVTETPDDIGAGATSSMQIAQGTLWISYADDSGNGLKVAYRKLSPAPPSVQPAPVTPPDARLDSLKASKPE